MEALDILEKEKNISKDTLLGAIEQSLIQACKNHFGKADNVHVTINPETCDFSVYAEREVKEFVDDPALEISLVDAQKINTNAELGDMKVKRFLNNVLQAELEPIRNRRKELQKDIPAIYEILKKGSEKAEAVAAQTLKEVKDAMKINYFDDKALIEAQAERFSK